MKSKQLANVLIKILGLSVLVHGIPSILTGLTTLIQMSGRTTQGYYWLYPVSSGIMVVFGIYFIVKSRAVAELLFKGEDE